MARIALTIAGAVGGAAVGWFWPPGGIATFESIAGAAITGASVGSTVGAIVAPGRLADGPRLADTAVSVSANGTPIPFGYAWFRVGGNIIWSPGIVEHKKEE